jgi:hypothetical protein
MTNTTAQAILALAGNAEELPETAQRTILAALLPVSMTTGPLKQHLTWDDYQDIVKALSNRDRYDAYDIEFADGMLECGNILGDDTTYLVDEDGSIGYDPAKAVGPEREAWDERARKLALAMVAREEQRHAETVVTS